LNSVPTNIPRSKTLFNRIDDVDSERKIPNMPMPNLPGHKKTISADVGEKRNFNLESKIFFFKYLHIIYLFLNFRGKV
jgi:hypothetical protein